MSNDAEKLQCLLLNFTNTMQNLFTENIEEYLNIIKLIEDWNKFKTIEDYINLNNKYINKALLELYKNDKCKKILQEETNINIGIIEKVLLNNKKSK